MPYTTIIVQRPSGKPAVGLRVSLGIDSGGVTDSVRTDSAGVAVINHPATGNATVYIDGSAISRVRVPATQHVVTID